MPSIGRILLLGAVVIVCAIMGWIVYPHPETVGYKQRRRAGCGFGACHHTPILILL